MFAFTTGDLVAMLIWGAWVLALLTLGTLAPIWYREGKEGK